MGRGTPRGSGLGPRPRAPGCLGRPRDPVHPGDVRGESFRSRDRRLRGGRSSHAAATGRRALRRVVDHHPVDRPAGRVSGVHGSQPRFRGFPVLRRSAFLRSRRAALRAAVDRALRGRQRPGRRALGGPGFRRLDEFRRSRGAGAARHRRALRLGETESEPGGVPGRATGTEPAHRGGLCRPEAVSLRGRGGPDARRGRPAAGGLVRLRPAPSERGGLRGLADGPGTGTRVLGGGASGAVGARAGRGLVGRFRQPGVSQRRRVGGRGGALEQHHDGDGGRATRAGCRAWSPPTARSPRPPGS